ncbi:MAG: hypothetical protein A2X32_09010 [Elusimicrobia bacterium GWC2_64_44]|nr:MAG: hypothetical protein A2X32_09010 [Elusimicrobia bacterium GWC2_64_44]
MSTDEALAKKNLGQSVSDILARGFFTNKDFTLVERSEFNRILSEQKLQASGIVESETQVRLGKMMGAKTILLGNIQKVGKNYQVNVRLVNVESGEVTAAAYDEFLVSAFQEDLRITSEETIGVSPFMDIRSNDNKTKTITSAYDTSTPKAFTSVLPGIGVFYRPVKHLMFVFDAFGGGTYFKTRTSNNTYFYELTLRGTSFGAAYAGGFGEKLPFSLGAGVTGVAGYWKNMPLKKSATVAVPYLRARLEFKPTQRFGIALAVKYDLKKIEIKDRDGAHDTLVEFSQLALQPALTLYF